MFALFICVTQDGWMGINEELQAGGFAILGAVYLVVFITIGAFVFANLVVADVVANLELAISEQHKLEGKGKSDDKDGEKPELIDSAPLLLSMNYRQQPLEVPEFNLRTDTLETLFTILSAIETNLVEFKQLKEHLSQIVADVKSLTSVDDLSDDEVFEFSTMATAHHGDSVSQGSTRAQSITSRPPPQPFRRHSLATDALSGLIMMSQTRKVNSGQVNSLQQLMHQLKSKSAHSLKASHSNRMAMSSSSEVSGRVETLDRRTSSLGERTPQ
jgi:hypothetical protein